MRLIQEMWARYLAVKRARLERLERLWEDGIKGLVQAVVPPGRKTSKQSKELDSRLRRIDRTKVLTSYLQSCQRQYYQRISAYIHASKAFRQGVKAFIYAKLKKGETVYLSGAPDFVYWVSVGDMQKMIQTSAEFL